MENTTQMIKSCEGTLVAEGKMSNVIIYYIGDVKGLLKWLDKK